VQRFFNFRWYPIGNWAGSLVRHEFFHRFLTSSFLVVLFARIIPESWCISLNAFVIDSIFQFGGPVPKDFFGITLVPLPGKGTIYLTVLSGPDQGPFRSPCHPAAEWVKDDVFSLPRTLECHTLLSATR